MKEHTIVARALTPGIALGSALVADTPLTTDDSPAEINVQVELNRFEEQLNHIAEELADLFNKLTQEIDVNDAQIIQTHQMILNDSGFKTKVINLISEEFLSVEVAVERVMKGFADRLSAAEDDYMRERANDFIDLARYFKNQAIEKKGLPREIHQDAVLIIDELFPSIVLEAKKNEVKGIIAASGAPTSHAAILARSFGLPIVIATDSQIDHIQTGDALAVDGYLGRIIHKPNAGTLRKINARLQEMRTMERETAKTKDIPAVSRDGTAFSLGVNMERLDELKLFSPATVDEIGLFRTEFLFMFDQTNFPSYEQQVKWYETVVAAMGGKPVTFRVLDIGGDKFLPYFSMGGQSNPYLGLRGHRVFRYHPEILEIQLRAILQAGKAGPVRILYPMINNLEEIDYLNGILAGIDREGADVQVGIMVETPAAVFMIDRLIEKIDFVSIGTNDLVQYTLTVDRNNENVMSYFQPLQPVILQMIKKVTGAAQRAGKSAAVCGEIASDPRWTPLLIGLGVRSMSMAPLLVQPVKSKIRSLNVSACEQLAQAALDANYEWDVERLVEEFSDAAQKQSTKRSF